ncbi:MAG: response regulator [Elusimicrobia bacterium]|nr:response regulator [Elusimicrobiota bacterium]
MNKKILLIEDNPFNREIAEISLRKAGYDIMMAENGEEGMQKLEKDEPDLVLLDLALPKISGWDIVKMLRQNPRYRDLPVIALTAHAMVGDKEKALEVGCSSYLSKPCLPEDIVKEVKKFI